MLTVRTAPIRTLAALGALLIGALVVPGTAPTADAAPKTKHAPYGFLSYAGGTSVQALGTTLSSDLTAQSTIAGTALPSRSSSTTADVKVSSLVSVGAVRTSTRATKSGKRGVKVVTTARTGDVNLLNGLITATAVQTTNTTRGLPTKLSASSSTRFVDLKIGSLKLPVDIPENFRVTVPGIATIEANVTNVATKHGIANSQGYALAVHLLRDFGPASVGSSIVLNPTFTTLAVPVPAKNPTIGGTAYGTKALVKLTDSITGEVGPTGQVATPPNSTAGKTERNRTATVDVPGILQVGAISSSTWSKSSKKRADIRNTSQVAGVNLLNGLITADALRVEASAKIRGKRFRPKEKLTLVNLTIAGQRIPINVGKNTKIDVAGLGRVTINQRVRTKSSNLIRAIHIKVLEPRHDLKVGAEIEIGVASTRLWR